MTSRRYDSLRFIAMQSSRYNTHYGLLLTSRRYDSLRFTAMTSRRYDTH